MKRHIGFLSVLLVGSGALVSCQDDTEHFDNKIYNTAEQTSTVFVEEEADSYVRTLQAQLAMPADSDISFAYVADPGRSSGIIRPIRIPPGCFLRIITRFPIRRP